MALILKQAGVQPLGQFDAVDTIVADVATGIKGGECAIITGVAVGSDLAAADADGRDGYVGTPPGTRPVVSTVLNNGGSGTEVTGPVGLTDDGGVGYGTLFGSVLGATVGQESFGPGSTGTFLGPHTAVASGKVTLWTKPGTYAVTLDATDQNATTGLQTSNPTLTIGDPLYAFANGGLLTPNAGGAVVNDSTDANPLIMGRFLNFETNGSLVTTPISLASAANSPVGLPGVAQQQVFTEALIEFGPAMI